MFRILGCCLFFALGSTCLAQFNYAAVNFPGAAATVARGINNSGEVVGYYQTTSCSNYDLNVPDCPTKGFKLVQNTYTRIVVSGSTSTTVTGVNDFGDLVGFYQKSDGSRHGFIWYHNNVVKTIDFPNSSFTTVPMGINNAGTVAGGVWGIGSTGTFSEGGWIWVNGSFSVMDPGGSTNGTCCQSVNGISNNGIIVGQVFYQDFWQAWLKESVDEDFWKYQGVDTFATALDINADVTGYSRSASWFAPGTESGETGGDTEHGLTFKAVSYPGSQSTQAFGMNDSKYLVGAYTDSGGKRHGFIAQPKF